MKQARVQNNSYADCTKYMESIKSTKPVQSCSSNLLPQNHFHLRVTHDKNGKLKRDYLAAFLPGQRNAPIQTLINFHYQNDELKSFRQFDGSGYKIYEYCEGKFFGEPLTISLDDNDFNRF